MREDPELNLAVIAKTLKAQYDLDAASINYLPIGYDLNAFVYEVTSTEGSSYFLKIRSGPVSESSLLVPSALLELGIRNVLAPLRTGTADLWCSLVGHPEYSVILYPFVRGTDAVSTGLTDDQWREFGSTLRAVHDSRLDERFRHQLPTERFSLPSAALVRRLLSLQSGERVDRPSATHFWNFWREHSEKIVGILARAESLGTSLQSKTFELVLCHSDIHAANILVEDGGRIYLVDWDSPLIAPRERDLLFVIGSRIARTVEPREEDLFFDGYGAIEIDPEALIYYRYERIIEDIGEMGKVVLLDPCMGEQAREEEAKLAMSFFAPGGDIERAETVSCHRWPRDS